MLFQPHPYLLSWDSSDMNAGFFIIDSHVLFLDCSLGSDWVISKFLILPFFLRFSWFFGVQKYNFLFILDTWFYVKRLWILFKSSVLARLLWHHAGGQSGGMHAASSLLPVVGWRSRFTTWPPLTPWQGLRVPVYSLKNMGLIDTMRMVGRYRGVGWLPVCPPLMPQGWGEDITGQGWSPSSPLRLLCHHPCRGPGAASWELSNGESRGSPPGANWQGKAGALFLSMVSDNYHVEVLWLEKASFSWLQLSLPSVFWGCWFYQHLVWGKWGKRKHRNSLLCYCLGPKSLASLRPFHFSGCFCCFDK